MPATSVGQILAKVGMTGKIQVASNHPFMKRMDKNFTSVMNFLTENIMHLVRWPFSSLFFYNMQKHGGMLRILPSGGDSYVDVAPTANRLLFFWSDRRNPHEVHPAHRTRYDFFSLSKYKILFNRPARQHKLH